MPTKGEVNKEIKKTEALLRKLKMQMMNPGLPMHLAPKGKKSKPKSRSKPRSRSRSKSKSRSRPRSKSRSRSRSKLKQRSSPGIQSKKKKMENLGVDPRLLFGLDSDELDTLLENPQLIKSMAPYSESFRPPDDDPPPVSPLGLYDYPFGDNPYHPSTLKRQTALTRPEPQPQIYMHSRFG